MRRKHVYPAHDHHVIATTRDFFHAAHAARASQACGQQAGEVTGTVADDGQGFFGQAGKDEFAHVSICPHYARLGVDDFGVEMVFPNRRAVLHLNTFAGYAGANDFAQAVNVHRLDVHALLNGAAHIVRPWLCAEYADAQ